MPDNEYAKRIVREESAKAALRPFIFALEQTVYGMEGVEYAEINPDNGAIFVEFESGLTASITVEADA